MKNSDWIDLQVNGYAGVDFNAPGLTVEAVKQVTERLVADGTAGYMPTLVTGDPEMLIETVRTVVAARRKYAVCEKGILGFFMEGPFISDKPGAVGTHPVEWVRPPDIALFLGHQLAKSPADVEDCIAAGAKAFTHLGNGIPNEVNRHDNIVYTALVEDRASVMFIPDGHHLPDTMLKLYCRAVPINRLVAVSDAQYPAGLKPGWYEVCGAHAKLEENGLLWNPERNCLVGATTPIAKCMEILSERVGLTPDECRAIGRDNPLRLIGHEGQL